MGCLLAAVNLWLPESRNELSWSRAVRRGMTAANPAVHTLAMPRNAALVLAAWLSSQSRWYLGSILVVQQSSGMRPGEAVGIDCADILLPEESPYQVALITLGARRGTKSGRPEAVRIDPAENPLAVSLLRHLKHAFRSGSISNKCSTDTYNTG